MKKPSLAKGTRDYLPLQAKRRNYIFDTIRRYFEVYGYQPLETPAMENLDTLTGKYGEEGDKLLFKILNSGDYLKDADPGLLVEKNSNALLSQVAEKGLRYDLTVPFARVVAMNRHELSFPFKRYQIQPVWRADRPQRGRYREFYQCDADVVGSESLIYEAELMQIYDQVFKALQIPVRIHINHRKILEGLAQQAGIADQFVQMTVEIDKLDKTGPEALNKALESMGLSPDKVEQLFTCLEERDPSKFAFNETARIGSEQMGKLFSLNASYHFHNELIFDPTLARGLSYYTGCIFEVKPSTMSMGSLGGGGRYDNLTEVFGLPNVSGVGISFGADRIYDLMLEHQLFPEVLGNDLRALFLTLDEAALQYAFELAGQLRAQGIAVDVYPEPAKLRKQFQHAEALKVPFALIVGEEELRNQSVNVKDQRSGSQFQVQASELAKTIC